MRLDNKLWLKTLISIVTAASLGLGSMPKNTLYAAEVQTPQIKWSFDTGKGSSIDQEVVGEDGNVYLTSETYPKGEEKTFYIYAIRPDGQKIWEQNLGTQEPGDIKIDTFGNVYVPIEEIKSGNQKLLCFDQYGVKKWTFGGGTYTDLNDIALGIDGDVYVSYQDKSSKVVVLNAGGFLVRNYDNLPELPDIHTDSNGDIRITSKNVYMVLNPDGSKKWEYKSDSNSSDYIYSTELNGLVWGHDDQKLTVLNPNGTLKWTYKFQAPLSYPDLNPDGTFSIRTGRNDPVIILNSDGSKKTISSTNDPYKWREFGIRNGMTYVFNNSEIRKYDTNGNVLWAKQLTHTIDERLWVPYLGPDGTAYITVTDTDDTNLDKLFAVNSDGSDRWSYSYGNLLDYTKVLAAGIDGTIYAQSGQKILAIDGSPVEIQINGASKYFDQSPIIIANRTLVPLKGIFQELGATVTWNQETYTVTATKGSHTVVLQIGSTNAEIDGKKVTIDVPARIVNNRTMVPVHFISDALGVNLSWNGVDHIISITTN